MGWRCLSVGAMLFALAIGSFGVRSVMRVDDWWYAEPPNSFVRPGEEPDAGPIAARVFHAAGVSRFPTTFLVYWATPRLKDHYWVAHLLCVILHAINVALVFLFARRVFAQTAAAGMAAALFAFWPAQAEVMFWASLFNYQLGMTLLLATALVWLGGGRHRYWIAPLLILINTQFLEQAAVASLALPALTVLDPDAGDGRTRWRRFVLHALLLTVPIAIWAIAYSALVKPELLTNDDGRTLPTRYLRTPLAELPAKALDVFAAQVRFCPFGRYDRRQHVQCVRRFPDLAADHPIAWLLVVLVPIAAVWAAVRECRPTLGQTGMSVPPLAESAVPTHRIKGVALFAVLVWIACAAPPTATQETWYTMRMGYAPGLGRHLLLAAAFAGLADRIRRDRPAWTAPAAAAFALLVCVQALAMTVEGRQYWRQQQISDAQAAQLREHFEARPGPRSLLIADITYYDQPLTVTNRDHVVSLWAYPWVARKFLQRNFPDGPPRLWFTGPENVGRLDGGDAREFLKSIPHLSAFRYRSDAATVVGPDELEPVGTIELRDLQGGRRSIALPCMNGATATVEVTVPDVRVWDRVRRH